MGFLDWPAADKHSKECEEHFLASPKGEYAYEYSVLPMRKRYDSGERTQQLYDEIMACGW